MERKENYMCDYCDKGIALVIGQTNDYGIAIKYKNTLMAYGYDVHGSGSNGLLVKINYCPMCGKYIGVGNMARNQLCSYDIEKKCEKENVTTTEGCVSCILSDAEKLHPYKVQGKPETYDKYNEGWNDALSYIASRLHIGF